MATEIFRFMTIRPPQEIDSTTATKNSVNLNTFRSVFIDSLIQQRKLGSRDGIERVIQEYRKLHDADLIDSRKKVDVKFLSLYESLAGLGENAFFQAARTSFVNVYHIEPNTFIQENDFKEAFVKVTNSIVIAAIDQNVEPKVRSLLIRLAQTLGLIQKLAVWPENHVYTKEDFRAQLIVLPEGIFPLPTVKQDSSQLLEAEKERLDTIAKNHAQLLKLAKELASNRNAINDVLTTFEKSISQPTPPQSDSIGSSALSNGDLAGRGFVLLNKDVNSLSDETKAILKKIGLDLSHIDVATATALLEKQASEISNQLYASRSSMKYMITIGNNLIPSDIFSGDIPTNIGDSPSEPCVPGMCPPAPSVNETDEVTVPPSNTHGEARVLGIADLMIVEQELLRYQLGEISRIENVLRSEMRDRQFRTTTTTEQSTLTETEVSEEKTKDLSSTERFELQTEAEKVINENTSIEAGVTINASYGPSVDATSNFNYTNNNSKQESSRASATFARETTTRATNKVQKRTLERQFVKTVNEIEEINKHSFDNTAGTENISGVYRFVDKVYQAQIVNYGKRLMLEFIVPEPAAFLRYAKTKQPIEAVTQIQPEPPGYCCNNTFVPLEPKHISSDHYLYWAGKYLAEDIEPPPAVTQIISGVALNETAGQKSQVTQDFYQSSELKDLKIPDGYRPLKAVVTVEGWNIAEANGYPATLTVQIQGQIFVIQNSGEINFNLDASVADKIPIAVVTKNYENFSIVADIYCILTQEKFKEWQLKTYNSIMNAYNDQKSRYDNAVETARIRAGDAQIGGTNPLMNRETEKTELKKGCISLLTAQRFETFDAMKRNVAPYGYPEIAFADAQVEGRYIQFFENAFEWINMTYIFYPYFWGKKDDWVVVSQLSDDDPLFTRFLQAGAARVQVPIRPGFETSLLHYLEVGAIWFGEGTLVNSEDGIADPLHVSVLDELKEELGNQNIEGKGWLTVKKDDTSVTGTETEFTANDENKRIFIKGKTYVIKRVISSTHIQLIQKYMDANESDVRYSMGPKLVGEPWEVKLPTDLVMIDEHKTLAEINQAI